MEEAMESESKEHEQQVVYYSQTIAPFEQKSKAKH